MDTNPFFLPPALDQGHAGRNQTGYARLARRFKDEFHGIRVEENQDFKSIRKELRDLRADEKSDFRILFGALLTATLDPASLMARGFKCLQPANRCFAATYSRVRRATSSPAGTTDLTAPIPCPDPQISFHALVEPS